MSKFTRKGMAGFMALWLSGIVFLLCCEMPKTQAAPEDSCPLSKMKGHCDKAKSKQPSITLSSLPDTREVDCCGFIPAVFDKARKIQKTEPLAQPAPVPQPGPSTQNIAIALREAFPNYHSKIIAGNKIFLKNRVLRI